VTDRLILVRHGVTAWNLEGRFQGQLDPALAPEGEAEARLLAERIASDPQERPARIVSSPLTRAARTAEIIAAELRGANGGEVPAVALDPRLMEIGQGDWEGRTHAELAVDDAERYAAWRRARGLRQPPGGEPLAAALARVRKAIDELISDELSDGRAWPLCIVSHGGTLRLAARQLLGLDPGRALTVDLDNASVSVLSRTAGEATWRIECWNDAGHLLGRAPLHVDEDEGEPLAL
jgi:probable phosphoglycerate mutase